MRKKFFAVYKSHEAIARVYGFVVARFRKSRSYGSDFFFVVSRALFEIVTFFNQRKKRRAAGQIIVGFRIIVVFVAFEI